MVNKIILASNSPRRKELLAGLDINFEVRILKGIDESYPDGLTKTEIPEYISLKKSKAYEIAPHELFITADTIVWIDGQVLGKPTDKEDARRMLSTLSGHTHQVITGVTLRTIDKTETFSSVTDVTFSQLTDRQITYYVEKYKPLDKAGAYGIQEWIGYTGITSIHGSYYNVVGLPVQKLSERLNKFTI